jgi:hypothetical protein
MLKASDRGGVLCLICGDAPEDAGGEIRAAHCMLLLFSCPISDSGGKSEGGIGLPVFFNISLTSPLTFATLFPHVSGNLDIGDCSSSGAGNGIILQLQSEFVLIHSIQSKSKDGQLRLPGNV